MIFFNEELSKLFRRSNATMSRAAVYVDGTLYDDTFYGGRNLKLIADASSVDYDRLRESRTTARVTLLAETGEALEALDPIDQPIVKLFSGIMVDGEALWAPLGTLTAYDRAYREFSGRYHVETSLVDLSELVRESKWSSPFQTGGGTYKAAIEAILADRGNPADQTLWQYEYTANNAPDLYYTENDDPWSEIHNLAVSAESEIYLAKNNWLVVDQVASPDQGSAVYSLGSSDFKVEDGQRTHSVSRREMYNGVIVRGEAPWLLFPISGEYWDDNPTSPTYRGASGENERPKIIGSAIATTNAHCAEIAEAEFHKIAGVSEEVTFQSLRDPYLDVGATIEVFGKNAYYTLDRLSYPLGSSSMRGTIRRKQI